MTKPGAVLGIAALGVRIEMRRTAGSACPSPITPSMRGAVRRHELIATCKRAGRAHKVALLDVAIHADTPVSQLFAAYSRWLGA